jgi:3-hydroxy-5-phosphonooxypentane-2,4-dione thiolase
VPDGDDLMTADRFQVEVPGANRSPAGVKGAANLGWGTQNRLSRIFRAGTGRTVMLAIDHGYFQGPTAGLERVDLSIVPLLGDVDALMLTRGMLRSTISPALGAGVVLRASGGPSVLRELSDERIALDTDDAVRLNAAALAVQVFIGGQHETQSVANLTRLVDSGSRYGIPVLGVTAVGRELTRDARYLRLACRIIAELGAQVVKTYYVDDGFDTITASCPVPVIMAGGKKLSEFDALTMASRAVSEGAVGVDMGRNIFQSAHPAAMLSAIRAVVHDDAKPADAHQLYLRLAQQDQAAEG